MTILLLRVPATCLTCLYQHAYSCSSSRSIFAKRLRITTVEMSQHMRIHLHVLRCFYRDGQNNVFAVQCTAKTHCYGAMSRSFGITWFFDSHSPFTTVVLPAYSVPDTKWGLVSYSQYLWHKQWSWSETHQARIRNTRNQSSERVTVVKKISHFHRHGQVLWIIRIYGRIRQIESGTLTISEYAVYYHTSRNSK